MPDEPTTAGLASPTDIAAALPAPEEAVALLDFDGTLSAIVDDPDAAGPVQGAADAVRALAARTRVLFVSGRSVDNLRPRLPDDLDVEFVGGHGAEYARGQSDVEPLVDDVDAVVRARDAALSEVRNLVDEDNGWVIEVKPTGMAVHWRMVEDHHDVHAQVMEVLEAHATAGLTIGHGHSVVELKPDGVDKGVAVARVLGDEHRRPVSFGDDVTDEDMFVEAVRRNGMAVVVAAEPRPTLATWRVEGPLAVVALLESWARA